MYSELVAHASAGWRRAQLCGPLTSLTSDEQITRKKLSAALGAAGQEFQALVVSGRAQNGVCGWVLPALM
jgi:hypothetical protein